MLIGVLGLQGDHREHLRALQACGVETRLVRLREDLAGLGGLVIPGGESTSMDILMERMGLREAVHQAVLGGLPALGTCAGMILLSSRIVDGRDGQHGFGALDIGLRRNGYGRQVESFEADLDIHGLEGGRFRSVFIRAPLVEEVGDVEVLAEHERRPVAVRQGAAMGLCFHPELSGDLRLHREFIRLAERHEGHRSPQ